jgi:hypothetical protein
MATILPTGETQFLDANGDPLAGGTVTFYIPGTTTPKDTWQNSGQSILNSNPVTLDAGGRAIIYGSGAYRQVVKDSLGNLIWDTETSEPNAGSVSFGGTSAGTANAQTLSAGQFSFGDGQIISFIAGLSNTGAMTISIGGSSPIPILKNGASGPVSLVAGDIVAGNSYFIQYSLSLASFSLLLSVAPAIPSGAFLKGYLYGLTLANDTGGDPANNIIFSAGSSGSDGTTAVLMTSAAPLTKKLNAAWVSGSGNGMLDTGSVADGTYHCFQIQRSDTGNVDFLASLSPTTPTMPTNYDRKRRIGSIIRVSGTILPFVQIGNVFRLTTAVVNRASVSPLSDSLLAVTAPLGVVTSPIMSLIITTGLNTATTTSIASGSAAAANIDVFSYNGAVQFLSNVIIERDLVFTDTSSQIRAKVAIISGTLAGHTISTLGWVDGRGITA